MTTPDCCKDCPRLKADGACSGKGRKCASWREWFRGEWSRIRRAAYGIKYNQEQTRK